MQCFGSFHDAVDFCSDDDEDEGGGGPSHPSDALSKWFMVVGEKEEDLKEEEVELAPKNALVLMRCRSAPAKGRWVEAGEEVVVVKEEEKRGGDEERLMLMSYAPDFFKLSTEIAKETWVVGSVDPLARCRSWKR